MLMQEDDQHKQTSYFQNEYACQIILTRKGFVILRLQSLFPHKAKTCHLTAHQPLHTYKETYNSITKHILQKQKTLKKLFIDENSNTLTFEQMVYHLPDSTSAKHTVFGQYLEPKHQKELFFLIKNIKSKKYCVTLLYAQLAYIGISLIQMRKQNI